MEGMTSEHVLLARIVKRGWTERLGREFESGFGEQIRWLIVVTMERVGTLQGRVHPNGTKYLEDRRLALYENSLSDLWYELLNGLVERYVEGFQNGKIHQEFIPYLRGVLRHLVIANARALRLIGRETAAELLASVCEAKRDSTYLDRLAWLKFCLEKKVRQEILARAHSEIFSTLSRAIHRVSDYFFEKFVPSQCERISRSKGSILDDLLDVFSVEAEAEEVREYIGTVTPIARGIDDNTKLSDGEDDAESERSSSDKVRETATIDTILHDERLVLWDHLIRGEPVSRSEISKLISKLARNASDAERTGSVLLLAAVRFLERARPSSRWRLRAALWYWFSQNGTRERPTKFRVKHLRNAGLADLAGLYLTWPEVMEAVGRKNTEDYSPLKRIEADLMAYVIEEWITLFGKEVPATLNYPS